MTTKAALNEIQDPAFSWAAYLAASWWKGQVTPPVSMAEPASVVSVLRANRFPLLSLVADRRPEAAKLLAQRFFQRELAEDTARLEQQRYRFREVRSRWAEKGITSLLLKALGPLPQFPYTSDNLDVLIPRDRLDEARRCLRDLDYVELRHLEEPNKYLFRRYQAGKAFFDLHLHGRIEWHVSFLDDEAVWKLSLPSPEDEATRLPSREDGILVTLAHALFENKSWALADLAKTLYALHAAPLDWDRMRQTVRCKGWLPGFLFGLELCSRLEKRLYGTTELQEKMPGEMHQGLTRRQRTKADSLSAGLSGQPMRIPFLFSKHLFFRKIWTDKTIPPTSRARDALTHSLRGSRLRLGLQSQKPMLIALEGIDGSGKTTQARLLAEAFQAAAIRHRIVWTRGGSSLLLQPAIQIGKKIMGVKKRPPTASPELRERERADLFRIPFIRTLWLGLVSIEAALSYSVRIAWPLLRGNVVIADRYHVGTLLDLSARLERPDLFRTLAMSILRSISPKPRFHFWLDVPWEEAVARKAKQESASFLRKQSELGPVLSACFGAVRLDGRESPARLSDRLIVRIMPIYLDSHRTWLNGFFCSNPRPLPWRRNSKT